MSVCARARVLLVVLAAWVTTAASAQDSFTVFDANGPFTGEGFGEDFCWSNTGTASCSVENDLIVWRLTGAPRGGFLVEAPEAEPFDFSPYSDWFIELVDYTVGPSHFNDLLGIFELADGQGNLLKEQFFYYPDWMPTGEPMTVRSISPLRFPFNTNTASENALNTDLTDIVWAQLFTWGPIGGQHDSTLREVRLVEVPRTELMTFDWEAFNGGTMQVSGGQEFAEVHGEEDTWTRFSYQTHAFPPPVMRDLSGLEEGKLVLTVALTDQNTTTTIAGELQDIDGNVLKYDFDLTGLTPDEFAQITAQQALNAGVSPDTGEPVEGFDFSQIVEIRFVNGPGGVLDARFDHLEIALPASAVPGDADGDGDVDAFDLGIWQTQFGQSGPDLSADFDDDGDVDAFDLGIWQINFGTNQNEAVPEPGSLVATLFGLAALTRRRTRPRRRP